MNAKARSSVSRLERLLTPTQFRAALEGRGPTFIKIGQFLAVRPDLLPQAYCDELLALTDDVAPLPFPRAQKIIEEDLGGTLGQLFAYVNPRPLAAASLAQVHEATTHDGAEVAVKVQRDDVLAAIDRDLRDPRELTRLIGVTGLTTVVPTASLIEEFQRFVHEELDLRGEFENLVRMHALTRGSGIMRVPRPYRRLSGRRVLTAELFRGVPVSELLRMTRSGEGDRIPRLGLDREVLASNLIHALYTQIFRQEFFHADPHPGNLIALPGNVIGFVDLAFVDTLPSEAGGALTRFLAGIYGGDVNAMLGGVLKVLERSDQTNLEGFRAAFHTATERLIRERELRSGARASSPVRDYMVAVIQAARDNGLGIPVRILAVYRALLVGETVAHELGSATDLIREGRQFFAALQTERMFESLIDPRLLGGTAIDLLGLLRDGPGQLQRLLADVAEDRFVLQTRTLQSPVDRRASNVRAQLLVLAIVSVGVAVLGVGLRDLRLGPVPLAAVLFAGLIACYARIALLWRRLP
jgi:ubiquinone biosynthesis protein